MRVSVKHHLDDLQRDCLKVGADLVIEGNKVVAKNIREGRIQAQRFAREASGPHGARYFKRISDEMTGRMAGEYGPNDGGLPVGAGWRHGPGNHDLERSLDIIGPRFRDDVDGLLGRLFWSGGDR
jgi:hypothetical protein